MHSSDKVMSLTISLRHLLDEEDFQRTIALERKRSERSGRSFLLILLNCQDLQPSGLIPADINGLLNAFSACIRKTDVIGWYKQHSVLGIVFTHVASEKRHSISTHLSARLNSVLYGKLQYCDYDHITISCHTYPEYWNHDVAHRPSDPTLYPDLSARDKEKQVFDLTKRLIDLVGSALALVILAPLFVAIALAIKCTSKGPVLFRQKRVGQFGTPFVFLKFRSMRVDNDCSVHREYVKSLISGKTDAKDGNGGPTIYKITNDVRITRVGAFLRRTSLDELPQFYNVIRGEMSLVGPRPAIPYEVEAYAAWHRRRVLEAKPGITGLWQVKGRSRVGFDEMVRLDVQYAMTRSLWLDLKILFQTPRAVILGEGAY